MAREGDDLRPTAKAQANPPSSDRRRRDCLTALVDARAELAETAAAAYACGRSQAEADCDRLEQIASHLLAFLDDVEPSFQRLAIARDVCAYLGPTGRRFERSRWDRAALALLLGEGFQEILSEKALAVLLAALRLESLPRDQFAIPPLAKL